MNVSPEANVLIDSEQYRQIYMSYVMNIQWDGGYLEYEQLFQRCVQNRGNIRLLDYYIALRSLRDGYSTSEVALILMQSPYVQQKKENQDQVWQYISETIRNAQRFFQQQRLPIFTRLRNFFRSF